MGGRGAGSVGDRLFVCIMMMGSWCIVLEVISGVMVWLCLLFDLGACLFVCLLDIHTQCYDLRFMWDYRMLGCDIVE